MARDNELRWTFSDVGSATNVALVDRDISTTPFRSGLVTLTATANQWAVGYSDALNFTFWRTQIADNTNLVSGVPTSAIPFDPVLNNGTSSGEYYLRASVAPVGFVGPEACQFIVQGANDTGVGAAPTANTAWSQVSGIGTCLPTASGQTVNFSLATPTDVTPTGAVPATGTIVMFTGLGGGAGPVLRTPYVVHQVTATTYRLATVLGGTTLVAAGTAGTAATTLVGQNATTLTPISLDDASDRIAFAEPVQVGDVVMFGANGSITGLGTAGTLYYVTSVTSLGATLSTTPTGATVAIAGSVTSAFAGKINNGLLPAIFPSSGTGNVITTALPHGLEVGQFVVPSATVAGGLTTGLGYYVLSTPTNTTFTVSSTINGAVQTVTATPATLFVGRKPKIVNVQICQTLRPWLRMAVQQLNGSAPQDGYIAIYGADISVGKDSAAVS